MGGASVGLAEGVSAYLSNPAAIAVRKPFGEARLLELESGLQLRQVPMIERMLGRVPDPLRPSLGWQGSLAVRAGRVGVSAHLREEAYLSATGTVRASLWTVAAGYAGNSVVVGVMPHVLVGADAGEATPAPGGSLGALWAPGNQRWRLGVQARSPMRTRLVRMPAQASLGMSYALGARNVAGRYGPARRQAVEDAPLALISVDAVWTGSSGDAVLLGAAPTRAIPEGSTVAVRSGFELWLLQQRARVRLGAYSLPGRGARPLRLVGTTGVAYEVLRSEDGVRVRAAATIEAWVGGMSWAVGLESW